MSKLEQAAAVLEATGDYRVLRRLRPRDRYCEDDGCEKRIGVVVDVETTGLDPAREEIIELGMVKFEYAPDGRVFRVLDTFDRLRQPSRSIPAEITNLTGIDDAMVAGKDIDPAEIAAFLGEAALVVAHNAAFDRKFCERFAPCYGPRAWACSMSEVNWRAEGYDGARLGYLLAGAGLFHNGHRAAEDCLALLEILARPLPKCGEAAFKRLLESARKATVRILAENSPFDMKDRLKTRGYRWNPGNDGRAKCWWRELPEDAAGAELGWLRQEIYQREADIPTRRITAADRHSVRA